MDFEFYLRNQIKAHPSSRPSDIVKLCYQAANGAEHLLNDMDAARAYLFREYEKTDARDIPLFEELSSGVCRVNIAAWKYRGLPIDWLFAMFKSSAKICDKGREALSEYIRVVGNILPEMPFSADEWAAYISEYEKLGMPAVHHSEVYREAENPAYRIVNSRYIRIIPILEAFRELPPKDGAYVFAIDGRAASGKSTLAEQLKTVLGAEIVHMDDFFLPTELRNEERLKTPGGNVHYERMAVEVLPYIASENPFFYRIFDCSKMDFSGERAVGRSKIRIVEGSYSHHPYFGNYADLTVFSDVAYEEQLRRIKARNGDAMLEMFKNRWIPLEEAYFEAYGIKEKSALDLN